jgi:hypothetical protein
MIARIIPEITPSKRAPAKFKLSVFEAVNATIKLASIPAAPAMPNKMGLDMTMIPIPDKNPNASPRSVKYPPFAPPATL